MQLITPTAQHLPDFMAALEQGWSPNNLGGEDAARQELDAIRRDPAAYLDSQIDPEAKGPPVVLPDGTSIARLPGLRQWLWDGEFCGVIGLRWQAGGSSLPPHVLGHVGYAVVPWKRRRGYATEALRQLLPLARAQGLDWIDLTTDPDNLPSQRVISANGGVLLGPFTKPAAFGQTPGLRYRITLA